MSGISYFPAFNGSASFSFFSLYDLLHVVNVFKETLKELKLLGNFGTVSPCGSILNKDQTLKKTTSFKDRKHKQTVQGTRGESQAKGRGMVTDKLPAVMIT